MKNNSWSGGRLRSAFIALTSALTVFAAACGEDGTVAPATPELPANPAIPAQYRGAAYIADVSTLRKSVRITAPSASIRAPITSGRAGAEVSGRPALGGDDDVRGSLLGGDVVDLIAANYQAGALGAVVPGKILITFDLQVVNKLTSVNLIVPTFPTPPAGTTGVVLFPFEIGVTTTSGGVSVGGAGNEVIVTSPRGGAVTVSNDWDGNGTSGSGAPHNFFNDVGCGANSNDCFRWEEYGVIPAAGTSTGRRVGFLIDPTVGDFRVKMILAADLQNSGGPAQSGTIAGTVTSPQQGAITGATISVSGGFTGTTAAGGAYSISGVSVGSRIVSVSNLPANCTAPASQTVTVADAQTTTANFSVTCSVLTGTVAGTVTSSLGGGISGVLVSVTPTGGSAQTFTTGGTGGYTVTVPVANGAGTVALSNLPANCTNPGPQSYSGLTSNGTVTANITVTCQAFGTLSGTVTSSLGGGLANVQVSVAPAAGPAPTPTNTAATTGAYSFTNLVPVGSGTVTLSNLPTNCTNPGAQPYTGVTNGGTTTLNVVVTCTPPPFTYQFNPTWGTISAPNASGVRTVSLTINIDMGAAPGDPTVNGTAADELVGAQFSVSFPSTLLTYASRTLDPSGTFDLAVIGSGTPGLTNVAVTSSQGLTANGVITQFVRLNYNIPAGASGTFTPTISFTEFKVGTGTGVDKKTQVTVNVAPLTIP